MIVDLPASPSPSPSPRPGTPFRAVALACRDARLAVAGGRVLRIAAGVACPAAVAGHVVALTIDGDRVIAIALSVPADARPARDLPAAAYAIAPAAGDVDDAEAVEVTIEVEAPPRTPPQDDIYLSTERSGWNAAEIRMDRIDPRRWRARLRLHRGTRLAFRITRGSIATSERNGSGTIPAPHAIVAEAGAVSRVVVTAWGDVS